MINVIHPKLIISLLSVSLIYRAYDLVSTIETIEKFLLELLPSINVLMF